MTGGSIEDRKRAAAASAVAGIVNDMIVGLGTGTTAAYAIAATGARVAAGLVISAVATSERTAATARAAGIRVVDLRDIATVDLCIDGVDEIDPQMCAIKGAGGAMLREKIVASAATRMIAIADCSKEVARLGARPVPIEILDFASGYVEREIVRLGGTPTLRLRAGGEPYTTDQGNPILDCAFGFIAEPKAMAAELSAIPGILGHGLFVREIDTIFVGTAHGVVRRDRPVQD